MKIKVIINLLLIMVMQQISAANLSLLPLHKLINDHEFIVYADIVKVEKIKWNLENKATLSIQEVIEGRIKKDTIHLFFDCFDDLDPNKGYREGEKVLVFFNEVKQGKDKFYTNGDNYYGLRTIKEAELKSYKKRIVEAQNILRLEDAKEVTRQTIDWLITCVLDTNKNLQLEGLLGLEAMDVQISDDQKERIRNIFFKTNDFSSKNLRFISFATKRNDTELSNFFVKKLKKVDTPQLEKMNDEEHYVMMGMMQMIFEVTKREDLKQIVEELNSFPPKNRIIELMTEFIKKV